MRPRPLSPHLQVYRLPLTAMLSISHRITGVMLSLGLLAIPALLLMMVLAPKGFALVQAGLVSLPGKSALWLWIYALYFHACHGIRHLVWDSLRGLDKRHLQRHNLIELGLSVFLTIGTFLLTDGRSLSSGSSP